MCGILAAWGDFDELGFKCARDLQCLRGPDDHGYYRDGNVQLGHRRLSIIDLRDEARQPMQVQGGQLVGVFNGEIYNYVELRKELESLGYIFHTESDTEVLLNAYHRYGAECLDLFIGMFAFVIYDKRTDTFFMARDRLGIKPLYYSVTDKGIIASSAIASVLELGVRRELDLGAVSSFFSYRYPVSGNSFYAGVEQLPPAHCATVRNGRLTSVIRYWDFIESIVEQGNDRGEAYYLERLKDLFSSSVAYRMRADVPVGAYLSGGVDSSAVVAEMAALTKVPVKTFTIGFGEKGYNEFSFARTVADRYQTDHHEININGGIYLDAMADLIRFKGAPLGVPNEVPLYLMSRELKRYVTVVLSGEGSDEIFGGYGRLFRSTDDYNKLQSWRAGRTTPAALAHALHEKYGSLSFERPVDHFLHLYRYTSLEEKRHVLGPRFQGQDYDESLTQRFAQIFASMPQGTRYLSSVMACFEKLHLPGLLQRVDISTMAASVEARVPFVDHRLVEFAFTVPEKYKLKWTVDPSMVYTLLGDKISETYDTPKYILKKAMEDKLGDDILYRRKMGFPVPLDVWFSGSFNDYAAGKLRNGIAVKEGLLNRGWVNQALKQLCAEPSTKIGMRIWQCLSFEMFLENF